MDNTLSVILLGIIEGITEFLPISSTGHLLIAEHWLGARPELFNIAIQSGAILAVVVIYRHRLWDMLLRPRDAGNSAYLLKLSVAFGVTAALGLAVKKLGFELPETVAPVAWATVIGALVIFGVERWVKGQPVRAEVTWLVAIVVGLAQVLAGVFPGTSRSGASIFAAMLAGTTSRAAATEFSFLVGIPTMFAATGYSLLRELRHPTDGAGWGDLAVGLVVSAAVAFVVVKWLLRYVQTHDFIPFAWYRLALGVGLLLFL